MNRPSHVCLPLASPPSPSRVTPHSPHPRPLSPEYRGEGRQEFEREAASLIVAPFSCPRSAGERGSRSSEPSLILAPFSPGTPGEKGWG